MKFTNTKKVICAACLLVAVATVAFFSASTFFQHKPVLANSGDIPVTTNAVKSVFITASNVTEASQFAGYKVSSPSYIPDGFKTIPNITVYGPNPNSPKQVMQIWSSGHKDTYFVLTIDTRTTDLAGAECTTFGSILAEKQLTEATTNTPALLTLCWRDGNLSYVLTGTLSRNLDETTLEKIASSIITN